MAERMSLEEEFGWRYDEDDNPAVVTDADVDPAEDDPPNDLQSERCLPWCPLFGRCHIYPCPI